MSILWNIFWRRSTTSSVGQIAWSVLRVSGRWKFRLPGIETCSIWSEREAELAAGNQGYEAVMRRRHSFVWRKIVVRTVECRLNQTSYSQSNRKQFARCLLCKRIRLSNFFFLSNPSSVNRNDCNTVTPVSTSPVNSTSSCKIRGPHDGRLTFYISEDFPRYCVISEIFDALFVVSY